MKIVHFDCFAGISGDMILGALVDAGMDITTLRDELAKLALRGWDIEAQEVSKQGVAGTKVSIGTTPEEESERHLADIDRLIEESELATEVKCVSQEVFLRLATAEAKVHGIGVDKVHFHEVGAVDSILDIVGAAIGLHVLGIEEVYASALHVGTGFVECAHGTLPLPAPATAELLAGVPTYSRGIQSELVTPTGAAILTTIAKGFGPMPPIKVEAIGYGAGMRDLPIPNLLRVFVGAPVDRSP